MGKYGITSQSQLIDVTTIQQGCQAYVNGLSFFVDAGKQIMDAGSMCNAQALSLAGESFDQELCNIGQEAIDDQAKLVQAAQAVSDDAVRIYNEQLAELKEYIAAQQRAAANRKKRGVTNG